MKLIKLLTLAGLSMFYLFLLGLCACQNYGNQPSGKADAAVIPDTKTSNILRDGSLKSPIFWPETATNGGGIRWDTTGLMFSANASGQYYVHQRTTLQASKFYRASVTVDYTLKDYSAAGIYVMDTSMLQTLGKFEKVYSSGTGQNWEFIFYSKTQGPVSVIIGFLNGINGTATFRNASIAEYDYQPRIEQSRFSAYLGAKLQLLFSAGQYDTSISKISDYVNSVLLSRCLYYRDTVELPILKRLIGSDPAYPYFNEYLDSIDSIRNAYCQKVSLSFGEILTNEFNIPVRPIYMNAGGVGLHQFLEYWNPFAGKWIIIDPYFNTRYERNGVLLGDSEIKQSTARRYIVRFGNHYFFDGISDLTWLWRHEGVLQVSNYYTISFPFSSKL